MARALRSQPRWIIAIAVVLSSWVYGTGQAEAGCGDHGYLVQRGGSDVLVVTPSQTGCPCKGPTCHQGEDRSLPVSPVWSPAPMLDAWSESDSLPKDTGRPFALALADPSQCLSAYRDEILQPPRA